MALNHMFIFSPVARLGFILWTLFHSMITVACPGGVACLYLGPVLWLVTYGHLLQLEAYHAWPDIILVSSIYCD